MKLIRTKDPRIQRNASIAAVILSILTVVFGVINILEHRPRLVEVLTIIAGGIAAIFSILTLLKPKKPENDL